MNTTMHRFTKGLHLFVIVALLAGLALGVAPVAQAATFNIADGDVADLIARINEANTNNQPDTINLAAGGTYTLDAVNNNTDGPNGLPSIGPDGGNGITINGNGATIQRSSAGSPPDFRIFHVADTGSLTLNDLTITNGDPGATFSGGGIYNEGTLTLENCTVSGNTAGRDGGGICNYYNGTLTANNSTVSSNTAGWEGGGIYSDDDVTLNNCTVSDNTAPDDNGGGIHNSSGTLTLENCTVSGNTADSGGGIYNYDGVLTLTNSTVSGNEATGTYGWGGGICNDSEAPQGSTFINCTISGNKATGTNANGGGIYHYGDLTMTNCTVSGNEANDDGGGIYSTEDMTLTNCTVTDNTADADNDGHGDGGGIYRESHTVNLKNTILAGNTDPTSDPDCYGTLTSYGYNLIQTVSANCTIGGDTTGNIIDQDPNLGPLQDNGGPTETHALLSGSPAIDAATDCTTVAGDPVTEDQRGEPRPADGDQDGTALCDIGAYEAQPPPEPVGGIIVPVNKLELLTPWLGLAALAALAALTVALVRRGRG